ncbi:MAG: hypothetical protein WBD00_05010 [Candidatus Omnitrophota bacterium]|jgi:hypothetical protein
MKLITSIIIIAVICSVGCTVGWSQSDVYEPDVESIRYQLHVARDVNEYLDDLFQKFSEGYVDPDKALEKVGLLRHEYNKLVEPVPQEGEQLHMLLNRLLSRIEYYFIHYKSMDRENPLINFQIAKARFEFNQEEQRLRYIYGAESGRSSQL